MTHSKTEITEVDVEELNAEAEAFQEEEIAPSSEEVETVQSEDSIGGDVSDSEPSDVQVDIGSSRQKVYVGEHPITGEKVYL